MLTREEENVLLKIGRASGPYRSAVLNALDCDVARDLVASGLAARGPFDDWFSLTPSGLTTARQVRNRRRP